jgi:hypothetical protein
MSRKYDVLALGDYCLDLIFTGMSRLPDLGQEVFATGFEMLPGGAYNTVAAMHRLGLRVAWAADFGNDEMSRQVLAQAAQEGLDDACFVRHDRPLRRITVAASLPQERAFLTYYDPAPTMPAAMQALAAVAARVVFVPGLYTGKLFEAGLLLVHGRRMKLVMDGNLSEERIVADRAVRRAISSVDVFMPNAAEARSLTGATDVPAACRQLAALGPLVVVKDGPHGAYACDGGEVLHAPALPVAPVDTTGAGDCFDAGFLRAWLDDRPLLECLRWGNIVGGLSTTARGGTTRVVTARDVHEWLALPPTGMVRDAL